MNEGEELGDEELGFDNNQPQESAEVRFKFIIIVIIIACTLHYEILKRH